MGHGLVMINYIIFDLGGVVVPEKWDEILKGMSEFLRIESSKINEYVTNSREKLAIGEISLQELYSTILGQRTDITPSQAVARHIELHKATSTERDSQIMDLIGTLKKNGYVVCCATNTEREIADYVNETQDPIFRHFEEAYISADMKISKHEPKFWENVLADLKAKPEQVVLIDNDSRYVEAAKKVGLHTILYGQYRVGYQKLLEQMEQLGINFN